MILIDTAILVALFRDRSGIVTNALQKLLEGREYYLTRFSQMELLQGAYNDAEWLKLNEYLANQDYLEMEEDTWAAAGRLYYEMHRQEARVRSVINCCISEIAMMNDITVIHNDQDFGLIARVRALKHIHFDALPSHGFHDNPQSKLPRN